MWIKDYRRKLRLTQEDLSSQLVLRGYNISSGAISHWESGRYTPPMDDPAFRYAIAKVFKISESELLLAAGYEIQTNHSEEGERAAALIDRMPKSRRAMAIDILERMVEG